MRYAETLDNVYRLAHGGMKLGLDRVRAASRALGSPHERIRAVQVAGTNGKGTVCALLENALRRCGLSTGLFTSPHLHRFTERIKLNGREIEDDILAGHLERVLALKSFDLSFFEVATLAALCAFDEAGVDVAVLEVGLGGRLDATSIVLPEVSVITSIGFDHTGILGNSIEEIASEKAAIARPGVPVFVGLLCDNALEVVEGIIHEVGASSFVLGRDFKCVENLELPWPGVHQLENASLACAVFEHLGRADDRLDTKLFASSVLEVELPGRFEKVGEAPSFILDGAHNAEAVEALIRAILESGRRPDVMLFGALKEKPFDDMYERLATVVEKTIAVPPPLDRSFDHRAFAKRWSLDWEDNIQLGLETVKRLVGDGIVLVTGSFFTVAEARRILLDESSDPPVGL